VDVCATLIAAERVGVHALRAYLFAHGFTHSVDKPLEIQAFFEGEVPRYLLAVLFGRDQRVGVSPGISVQEGNGGFIFMNEVLRQLVLPRYDLADKARFCPHPMMEGLHIRMVTLESLLHVFSPDCGRV
jgi:hypothetical protein